MSPIPTMPSVTIVIPVFNREAYLPRLFRSLAAVDYEDMEVILVDNGSTDNSLSLCRSFAEDAPMVVSVAQEPERGASKARNRGLALCRTEWVYFFDSDDELSATFLEELMPFTEGVDFVAFPTRQEVDGREALHSFRPSNRPSTQVLSSTLNTPSMLLRTDFLRSVGGWNGDLPIWDDWELGIRLLLHRPRVRWFADRPFHHIHVHPDSITGPSMSSRREALAQVLQVVDDELTAPRDRRALYLRRCILNGLFLREDTAPLHLPPAPTPATRLMGLLLQRYTAWGGRGAWRIALHFC